MTAASVARAVRGTLGRLLLAIDRILERFPTEAAFLALRASVEAAMAEGRDDGSPELAWYEIDPDRLRREMETLRAELEPEADTALLGIDAQKRVAAIGRIRSGVSGRPRLAVVMPPEYPESPPAVYVFNRNLPVELPLELGRTWTSQDDSGLAIRLAREFLRERLTGEGGR